MRLVKLNLAGKSKLFITLSLWQNEFCLKMVCLLKRTRGDRPEPFNSCILQAWSVGMYIYAIREMMLGMKLNMIENKIQFEPQIPESLRNNAVPINFEHNIDT